MMLPFVKIDSCLCACFTLLLYGIDFHPGSVDNVISFVYNYLVALSYYCQNTFVNYSCIIGSVINL